MSRIIAGTISDPATATNGSRPRKTQRHPTSDEMRSARAGPIMPGTTHAVDSTANMRARLLDGVHAADRHIADRRDDTRAETLDEAADDEDRHRRRQPADGEPDGEQHEADDVGPAGPVPVGLLAGEDDADHRPEEERRRHPAVPGDAAEVLGDVGQDRDHGERLERDQRHDGDEADRQRAVSVVVDDPRRLHSTTAAATVGTIDDVARAALQRRVLRVLTGGQIVGAAALGAAVTVGAFVVQDILGDETPWGGHRHRDGDAGHRGDGPGACRV